MAPPLALQAVGGFLLAFFSIYMFLTYNQTVSEHFIGGISSRGDENDVTTSLVTSSPMCRLYPVGLEQGAIWQAIVFLHLTYLWHFVWLEVQRDELHYDWEGPLTP